MPLERFIHSIEDEAILEKEVVEWQDEVGKMMHEQDQHRMTYWPRTWRWPSTHGDLKAAAEVNALTGSEADSIHGRNNMRHPVARCAGKPLTFTEG